MTVPCTPRRNPRLPLLMAGALFVLAASGLMAPAEAAEHRKAEHAPQAQQEPVARRGETMASVRSRLGEPQAEKPAVGEPPITRWVYPRYVVYFEHDRVIHTVDRVHSQ